MAPSTGKDGHEQDLASILATEERVELTLLLANITELMRKQVEDTFDASMTSANSPQQAINITDKNPNVDEKELHEETEEEEQVRKMREKREEELSAPKMQELKKDALEFFDKWRDSVILRVGQVINNPEELTEDQKKKASVEATPNSELPAVPKVIRESYLN